MKLLRTLRIEHASTSTAAPRVAIYSKYKPLKQKLTGPLQKKDTSMTFWAERKKIVN